MELKQFHISKEYKMIFIFILMIFLHGAYFYYETMIFGLFAFTLFVILVSTNKNKLIQKGRLVLPFLYLFFYVLPILNGNIMHIYGIFKMIVPFYLVWTLSVLIPPVDLIKQILKAYIISLVFAFVIYGWWVISKSTGIEAAIPYLVPVVIKGRFTGFLQYANVNAILSLIAGVYAIYGWKKTWAVLVTGFSLGLSGSRTAWFIAAFLIIFCEISFCFQQSQHKLILKRRLNSSVCNYWFNFVFILMAILGGIIVDYSLGENRLVQGLKASEFQTRLLYYKDGIQLILKNPLGYGHYGYYMVQRQFQTGSTYLVKYIHNFILQIILDGGVVSGVIFLLIIFQTLYFLVKIWLKTKSYQVALITFCYLALLAHSVLDFNFEFVLITVLVWLVYFYAIHMYFQVYQKSDFTKKWKCCYPHISCYLSRKKILNKILLIKGVALCLGCIILGILSGLEYLGYPQTAARLGFIDSKIDILDKGEENEKYEIAKTMTNNSIKNLETFAFLRNYYYNRGKLAEAIKYGRVAVDLAPLWIEHRRELMRIEYAYALKYPYDINKVAEDILTCPQKLLYLKEQKETSLNVKHKPQWEMTEEMEKWYFHFKNLYKN